MAQWVSCAKYSIIGAKLLLIRHIYKRHILHIRFEIQLLLYIKEIKFRRLLINPTTLQNT